MIKVENQIVMKRINEIKPYIRNPRKNEKTVDLLTKVIPKVGFNVPIVIDDKGIIVKGHARFTAAIRLGMEEVPCIVTHADEEAIKADRITDNKISEFSEWVNDELMHELDMIDIDIDFNEIGLPTVNFDDMPSAEDFEVEETVSDEEKQRLYEQFLAEQAKQQAEVTMTDEKKLTKAVEQQHETAVAPRQYYKCVCEKCGHTFFVDANEKWSPEGGLDR